MAYHKSGHSSTYRHGSGRDNYDRSHNGRRSSSNSSYHTSHRAHYNNDDNFHGQSNEHVYSQSSSNLRSNNNNNNNNNSNNSRQNRIDTSKFNRTLPVFARMNEIINTVKNNKITLIVGETGSGKTTQIGQYLMQCFDRQLICTQPRKMAAINVAIRVASEQGENIGQKIGYKVRLEQKFHDTMTQLLFMTEGTLLRIAMGTDDNGNSNLNKYSVIIIDEAHERTVNADLLMGFLKEVVLNKSEDPRYSKLDLKLVIMSATLDEKRFLSYFENPKLVRIPGTLHPIEHYFLHKPTQDYIEATVQCVLDIHNNEPVGDILVFMPGKQEIEQVIKLIDKKLRHNRHNGNNNQPRFLETYPLYAILARERQQKAIDPNPHKLRTRKCVVSTNIAETSLTIQDIVYVIDCGLSKQTSYDATSGIGALSIQPISKASVKQRQGRAGRVQAGKIYHLYTQDGYGNMQNETPCEIVRTSLVGETLTMLALGIDNPVYFDYIDAPDEMTLARALTMLKWLECIDERGRITQLGKDISLFPLEARMGRSILMSIKYKCLNEMLSIAAMLEVNEKLWIKDNNNNNNNGRFNKNDDYDDDDSGSMDENGNNGNNGKNDSSAKKQRAKFAHIRGDHLTLLNIFFAYLQIKHNGNNNNGHNGNNYGQLERFCESHMLKMGNLNRACDIRQQLEKIVYRIEAKKARKNGSNNNNQNNNDNMKNIITFDVLDHKHKDYYDNILKALLSGHFLNLACLRDKGKYWIYRVVEMDENVSAIDFIEKASVDLQSVFGGKNSSKSKNQTNFMPNWVLFDNVCKDGNMLKIRTVSSIQPLWIPECAPHYFDLKKLSKDQSCITHAIRNLSAKHKSNQL